MADASRRFPPPWRVDKMLCGRHLSGLSAMTLMAFRETRMLTSRISSVLAKNDRSRLTVFVTPRLPQIHARVAYSRMT
jgi:hypothetical protein